MSAFMHPAYWGSLLALLMGIGVNVVVYLGSNTILGNSDNIPIVQSEALILASTIITALLAIRYYVAVSTNVYCGMEKYIFDLPFPLNVVMFSNLCLIILLCNVVVVIFSLYGPFYVVLFGPFLSIVSLAALVLMFIAHCFRRETLPHPPPMFIGVEMFLLLTLLVIISFSVFDMFDTPYREQVFIVSLGVAGIIFMLLHEFWNLFRCPLRNQMNILFDEFRR